MPESLQKLSLYGVEIVSWNEGFLVNKFPQLKFLSFVGHSISTEFPGWVLENAPHLEVLELFFSRCKPFEPTSNLIVWYRESLPIIDDRFEVIITTALSCVHDSEIIFRMKGKIEIQEQSLINEDQYLLKIGLNF